MNIKFITILTKNIPKLALGYLLQLKSKSKVSILRYKLFWKEHNLIYMIIQGNTKLLKNMLIIF